MFSTPTGLFIAAAAALLGSPGPGIAALIAVGRAGGWRGGLPFFFGLQLGLAIACGATALGLFTLLAAFPAALRPLSWCAVAYLLYLAYRIATAKVGSEHAGERRLAGRVSGFLLGISNPKAYFAFASLFASETLVEHSHRSDMLLKWSLCLATIFIVDLAWLAAGSALRHAPMGPLAERIFNSVMGAAVLMASALMLVGRNNP